MLLNATVLMSGTSEFALDAQINPYYDSNTVDRSRAAADHENIANAFAAAGITVLRVDPPAGAQDGVYTANWALASGRRALLARLPNVRQCEEAYAEQTLTGLGLDVTHLPDDVVRFSGQGDSLPCGKYLLGGSGYRSDRAAQEFAADFFSLELVQLHALPQLGGDGQPVVNSASGWPDSFFYDIDLAVAVLRDDMIAYCPDALDEPSRAAIDRLPVDKITVGLEEAIGGMACNLVSTGETVVMSAAAPVFQADLRRQGFTVLTPDVRELNRGGGFIRCVSLTLD